MTTYSLTTNLPNKILRLLRENNIEIPMHKISPKVIDITRENDLKYDCIDIISSLDKVDISLYVDTKMQNLVHLVLFYYCYDVDVNFDDFLEDARCGVPSGNMYQFGNGASVKKALEGVENIVGLLLVA